MKKRVILTTAVLMTAALLLTGCGGGLKQKEQGPPGVDWPMYGGSPARLGYSTETLAPPFQLRWSAATGELEGGAAVAGGRACVADTDGLVHCFKADTGDVDWTFQADGPIRGQTPLIYDTRVYAGSDKGTFYCLNALGGLRLWQKDLGSGDFSSPLGDGGKVYVSHGPNLFCFEARKGDQVFSHFENGVSYITAPALSQGVVCFGSDADSVVCLDGSTGAALWRANVGADVTCAPVIGNSRVFFGTSDNQLWCLALDNGETVWKTRIQQKIASPPAISGNNLVIGTGDKASLAPGVVWCLDAASGSLRWSYETDYTSPLQVSATAEYAFVHSGLILTLSGGTTVTSLQVDGTPYAPPVPHTGRLYVCDAGGGLNCLGP